MAATSAVILYYLAGLCAGVAVEQYKTYKQFEIPTLAFKTSSSPGEIYQFRQKRKARLKCSGHVCVPCSACGDFAPPGMLLCYPPADHQHEVSWHSMFYKNDSKHDFSLVSLGLLTLRAFCGPCRWIHWARVFIHCLYNISLYFISAFFIRHYTSPVASTVQPRWALAVIKVF